MRSRKKILCGAMLLACMGVPATGLAVTPPRRIVYVDAPIAKGTVIQEEHLSRRLDWVPEDGDFLADMQGVAGIMAPMDLKRGASLESALLERSFALDLPPGGAVVSLSVNPATAGAIRPEMRIAFVRKLPGKSDSEILEILPAPRKTGSDARDLNRGYRVLSVNAPEKKESHTVVTVAVPRLDEATKLAAYDWQPIVLGAEQ